MTYQTQLRPWCIVRQLSEKQHTVVDRFRHYQDADALVKLLRRKTPDSEFFVTFQPQSKIASEPVH